MNQLAKMVQVIFWPLFLISLAFPILAGFGIIGSQNPLIGYIDVLIAFLLVGCLVVIDRSFKEVKPEAIQQYKYSAALFLVAILAYFLFKERINWEVLLIGLGWRLWLFFQVLPYRFRMQFRL